MYLKGAFEISFEVGRGLYNIVDVYRSFTKMEFFKGNLASGRPARPHLAALCTALHVGLPYGAAGLVTLKFKVPIGATFGLAAPVSSGAQKLLDVRLSLR